MLSNIKDFSCDELIRIQESVEDCIIMTEGFHAKLRAYYFCPCDPDCQDPICEACLKKCHSKHWENKPLETIPIDFRNALCNCGQRNHSIEKSNQKNHSYTEKCLFIEWSIVSKTFLYYENQEGIQLCLFCYNLCNDQPADFKQKTTNEAKCKQVDCCCTHSDYNLIFDLCGKLCRAAFFIFEHFRPTQFANLILLSKTSFNNAFHNVIETVDSLGIQLENSSFDFYPFINNSSFMKALDKVSEIVIASKSLFYFIKGFESSNFIFMLLERKFNYRNDNNIWLLKRNMFLIYHKTIFKRDFELLAYFSDKDIANLNPFQRLMHSESIKLFQKYEHFTMTNPSNQSHVDSLLRLIEKYKNIKSKNDLAYDILKIAYAECKKLIMFNCFTPEQCMKFYSLNDEIIYMSINNKDIDIMSGYSQMKMLNQMTKCIFFLAYYYNDSILKQYLSNQLSIAQVSLFHSKNESAKMIYRNCTHILLYCRTIYNECSSSKCKITQTTLDKIGDIHTKISKLHNRIMFIATDITALTLNYPDTYLLGLRRLVDKSKETYVNYINGILSQKEDNSLEMFKRICFELENTYYDYHSYEITSKDVEENVIEIIDRIFSLLGNSVYHPQNKHFEGVLEMSINNSSNVNDPSKSNCLLKPLSSNKVLFPKGKVFKIVENNIENVSSKEQNIMQESLFESKCRVLINKTPLVFTIIKSFHMVFHSWKFDSNYTRNEAFLEHIFRFLFYFVTDSPDNCVLLLNERILQTLLVIPNNQIIRVFGLLEYSLKILKENSIHIGQITQLLKTIEIFAVRIAGKSELLSTMEHLMIIMRLLVKIHHLHQEHTFKKMRKIMKQVFLKNKILGTFRDILIQKDDVIKEKETIAQMIYKKIVIEGYDIDSVRKIFTMFLKIINYLFDGNSTMNEISFLGKIFRKTHIPKVIIDKSLPLDLRIEILKFFRILYIDVMIEPQRLQKYYKIFANDIPSHTDDNAANFTLFQDLVKVKDNNIIMSLESSVINFELKNFPDIVNNCKNEQKTLVLKYFEIGIILPLHIFLNKYMSIIYNLDGIEFIRLYEIVLHFLELKKYLVQTQRNDDDKKKKIEFKTLFKSLIIEAKNQLSLIQHNINKEDEKILLEDIGKLQDPSFEILNYKQVYSFFEKHVANFIKKPNSKYLKEVFSKKDKIYTEEEVAKREKEYRKNGILKTDYESQVWEFILKYENDKARFTESSLSKNLGEKNILYDGTYRSIMLRPMFHLINCENLYLKYRRQNLWNIFRLLQYDTGGTQEDILLLKRSEVIAKNKRPTINLMYLTNVFMENLLSIIFYSCNPSVSSIHEDYTIAYMVIKIFKYMCEDHNQEFQTIFFKEIKIPISANQTLSMFDLMMCSLSKIAILAKWDKVTYDQDENSISYFYEIFFVMIEFSIELIQGTTKSNLEQIIKAKDLESSYFSKFLMIVKGIVTNNNNNSEIVYNLRLDIINFIVAFLEEKNSPQKLINIIANVYNPLTVFDSIVNTLKKLYLKYTKKDCSFDNNQVNLEEFDNKKCSFFIQKYFSNPEFSQCQEFECANRMYNYVKLLANSKNKDAKMIIDSIKLYTENELLEFSQKKKTSIGQHLTTLNNIIEEKDEDDLDNEKKSVLIDPKYIENYFTVKFLEEITRTVWIKGEEDKPQMVLFTKNPTVMFLSQDTKIDFYRTVPRDSRSSKLFALMEYCTYFFIEINQNKTRLTDNYFLKFLDKINYRLIESVVFLTTVIINIIIFLLISSEQAEENYHSIYIKTLPLAIFQAVLNPFFFICWMISKFSLYFVIETEKYYLLRRKKREESLAFYEYLNIIFFYTLLSKKEIISFIWNTVFSLIGISSSKNIFLFSIQLLIVVNLSETLRNLVRAVTMRYRQLLTTFLFLFVVIYIFSVIAFFFFSRDFVRPIEENQENTCASLLYCYFTHMTYGLRIDGGIGEWIKKSSFLEEPAYFMGMFFFQFLFFAIIIVIMLAVIGGSIIDTFAELREKSQEDTHDKTNVCYICNGERNEIEKQGENFEEHITNVHNMWTYVDYMIGLKFVDPQETNAINSFVIEQIEEKKISWFPTFSNKDNDKDEDDNEEEDGN